MGLSADLGPHIFQLVQAAKDSAQELKIDDMMAALVDHDKRSQYLEDTEALAVNLRDRSTKSASGERAKPGSQPGRNAPAAGSPTPGTSKKDRGTGPCDHCGEKSTS